MRRGADIALRTLATAALFVAALVGGAILHLDTPLARRVIATEVNRFLATKFVGKVVIEHIGKVHLDGADDVAALVRDPAGRVVLRANGVSSRIVLLPVVWAELKRKGDIPVALKWVHAKRADLTLITEADGKPSIAHAFDPSDTTPSTNPRDTRFRMPDARVDQGRVTGRIGSSPRMDMTFYDLDGGVASDPEAVTPEVRYARIDLRGPLVHSIPIVGRMAAKIVVPSTDRPDRERPLSATASFDGVAGEVPAMARGRLDRDTVDGSIDLPEVRPDAVHAFAPGLDLAESFAAHGEIRGTLGTLRPKLQVRVGGGTIEAAGVLSTIAGTGEADVDVRGVELRRVTARAPKATVNARGRLSGKIGTHGDLSGDAVLRSVGSKLGRVSLPPIDVGAHLAPDQVSGAVHMEAPEAPADLEVKIQRAERQPIVDFGLRATARELSRVPELRSAGLRGALDVRASGHVDVRRNAIDAQGDGRATALGRGTDRLHSGSASAHIEGPLNDPSVLVSARAEGIEVGGHRLDLVTFDAEGSLDAIDAKAEALGGGQRIMEAHSRLSLRGGVSATDARGRVALRGVTTEVHVDHARIQGRHIEVANLAITGLGAPARLDADVDSHTLELKLAAPRIDVGRVARLLGETDNAQGEGAIDAEVHTDARGDTGHVDAWMDASSIAGTRRSQGRVLLKLADHRLDGGLQIQYGDVHFGAALADAALGGPIADPHSWFTATGAVEVRSDVELSALQQLLPADVVPLDRMSGKVTLEGRLARARPAGIPDAKVTLSTRHLALRAKAPQAMVDRAEAAEPTQLPWEIHDLDLEGTAGIEGEQSRASLHAAVVDPKGSVASVEFEGTLPKPDALRGPPLDWIAHMPFRAHAEMPMRDVTTLPDALHPPLLAGNVGIDVDTAGSLAAPRLEFRARAHALRATRATPKVSFDASMDASYDGSAVIARTVLQQSGKVVLDGRTDVDVRVDDLLAPPAGGLPWDATTHVAVHDFPLDGLPFGGDRSFGGLATGNVGVEGLHRDGRVEADLHIAHPRLGAVCFERGALSFRIDRDHVEASTRFEQPDSLGAATVKAGARWGAALAPSLDTAQPAEAQIQAKAFRAAAFLPLLGREVNQLDGRIDADARIRVDPGFKNGEMVGDVRLSHGVVEVPVVGAQFHDVQATASIRPWGTLRVDGVKASGSSGRLTASGQAQFDALDFASASFDVDIGRKDKVPITAEGVPIGEAWGKVHVDASMSPDRGTLEAKVDVPQVEMDLPDTSGHGLQSLDLPPQIIVGRHERDNRFVELALRKPQTARAPDALRLHIEAKLGDDVVLKRDANLDLKLTGTPVIDIGETTAVNGTIHITRGMMDVFGKRFEVQPNSTVSYVGDTSNPQLKVTASNVSSDGTRIFADVTGPLKTLKVNLRSEPPLSQDEILNLLVVGSESGLGGRAPAGYQPDPTQRAAGLAGTVVAQGLNSALAGITSLQIATRVDTSQAANPRPEVDVRVSSSIVARVSVNTGMPAPGEPPDRTLLGFDWHFRPRWSLRTTVGDEGSSSFELFWQHRY
jgi:translocation and assembly module TamB